MISSIIIWLCNANSYIIYFLINITIYHFYNSCAPLPLIIPYNMYLWISNKIHIYILISIIFIMYSLLFPRIPTSHYIILISPSYNKNILEYTNSILLVLHCALPTYILSTLITHHSILIYISHLSHILTYSTLILITLSYSLPPLITILLVSNNLLLAYYH